MKKGKSAKKKDELKDLQEQLARAVADYDNLRKRVEREREELGRLASIRLIIRLLPVYDMLEGAQKHLGDTGIAITIEEFAKVLKDEGIEKIEVKVGDRFNEEVHEAVEVEEIKGKKRADGSEASGPEGRIKKVILTGWRVADGPIVRPAKVKVSRK